MKKKLLALLCAMAFTGTSTILHAEDSIDAGKEKAAACMSCHGEHGNSLVATFPKLAGQHSSYLIKQLEAFKNGTRKSPMMSALAMGLSDKDIKNIAAYFSSAPTIKTETNVTLAKVGQAKASMCLGCHGSTAEGNGQFPRLAGQRADYLVNQLTNFKAGARKNGQMQAIANMLSEEDMQALAAYFSGL